MSVKFNLFFCFSLMCSSNGKPLHVEAMLIQYLLQETKNAVKRCQNGTCSNICTKAPFL